ncbi:hypothetical protein [Humibacillus xanthopallidus]|uniref:hypothetical protein n=1 Tax=Humibacillus xanthopallidus TaxID=412689 RepID=UPI00384D65CD
MMVPADSAAFERPVRYWHGTRASLKRGDALLARSVTGTPRTRALMYPGVAPPAESADWVYVTTRHKFAWMHAFYSGADGDPIVLLVEPDETLERDPEYSARMQAFRCRSAQVILVDTTPAITEEEAASGWASVDGS